MPRRSPDRSRRPLIWAGGGARGRGRRPSPTLAERLVAPVITTWSARGMLGADHPCLVQATPHVPECGALWDEADCVIAIGTDFDAMMTQGWRQTAAAAPDRGERGPGGRVEELPAGCRWSRPTPPRASPPWPA